MLRIQARLILIVLLFMTQNLFAINGFTRSEEINMPDPSNNIGGVGNMISGVDVDGDGLLEIYLVNDNWGDDPRELIPRIYKLEKDGFGWNVVWEAIAPVMAQNTWPTLSLADLDNDGKQELVWGIVNNFATESNPYRIVVYEHLDGDSFGVSDGFGNYNPNASWTVCDADNANMRIAKWSIMDIDNDGIDEILFADRGGYLNYGALSVSDIPDNGDGSEIWSLEVSSDDFTYNANSKWDIGVIGNSFYTFDDVAISKTTWNGVTWEYSELDPLPGGRSFDAVQSVDLDGDGLEEMITGDYHYGDGTRHIWLLQDDGLGGLTRTALFDVKDLDPEEGGRLIGGAHGDIDGDGNMDFVFGSRYSGPPNAPIFRLAYRGGDITSSDNYEFTIIDTGYVAEGGVWNVIDIVNMDDDPDLEVVYTSSSSYGGGPFLDPISGPIIVLDLEPPLVFDFFAVLTISDDLGSTIDLEYGTSPAATDGYDAGYDVYSPPSPPTGAFDARFTIGGDDYLSDFRTTILESNSITWEVQFAMSSGAENIILEWDPAELPGEGIFSLADVITGEFVNVDMRLNSSVIVDQAFITALNITYTSRILLAQNLDIGGDEDLQHLLTHDPMISFDYFDGLGEAQTHYQVQISSDPNFQGAPVWDTGEVASAATTIQYDQGLLADGATYYLRVRVASGDFWSDWSELVFRMNSIPAAAVPLALINDAVATAEILLNVANAFDAEADILSYDFRLYADEALSIGVDSALMVLEGLGETSWYVPAILNDNARYWWTVQVYDGYEYSAIAGPESFLVNNYNDVPDEFSLLSPEAEEVITSLLPRLTWEPATDPDPLDVVAYVLYLDTPAPGVITIEVGADTSYQVESDLVDQSMYHWKVVASDTYGESRENTGGYQSFMVNTANDLPEYFDLLYPVDDMMVTSLAPEFLWEASSDPDDEATVLSGPGYGETADESGSGGNSITVITGYEFYLGTDAELTDVVPVEVMGTSYTPVDELIENQVYYWAVSALDDSGSVTFSDTTSFWTNAENEAPAEFSLLTPAEAEVLTVLMPTFTWTPSSDPDLYDGLDYFLVFGDNPDNLDTVWTGTDTTVTLEWELEDNSSYYWMVITEDWSGLMTTNTGGYQSFTINTTNDLPEYFDLLYPVDDMMVTSLAPEFLWEASSDPDDEATVLSGPGYGETADESGSGGNSITVITGYEFYLGTDAELTDVVPVEVMGTSYTPVDELIENQVYYWAVSALDDSGSVTFSDTTSFWTNAENEAPAEFSLLTPAEAEVLTVLMPTFTWTPSSDPDLYDGISYYLVFGNAPNNLDTVWTGSDTTVTLEWELEDNAIYYWVVLAEDWSGLMTVNTGGYQSFAINLGNDDPSVVDLISPDSVMVLTLSPEMHWTVAGDVDPGDVVSYEMHWWGADIEFDSVLTDTNAIFVPRELVDNTQYFWQVITMDQNGGISQSEDAMFWTDLAPEAPVGFALVSPEDDVTGLSDMPVFLWESAVDPDPLDYATYTLQVATDSSFSNIAFQTNTNADVGHEMSEALPIDTEYWWRVIATDTDSLSTESEVYKFTVGYVSVAEGIALPTEYVMQQNFPNPFNPSTTLRYGIPEEASVSLIIYDIRGNRVKTITAEFQPAGWYEHVWNGMDESGLPVSTGLYLTRLQAGSYSKVIKMLYLK